MRPSTPRVSTGLDRWVAEDFAAIRGQRVGVIANPTSVDHRIQHIADHLREASGVTLGALFGPEHGIRADVQDMVGVASGNDSWIPGSRSIRSMARNVRELDAHV